MTTEATKTITARQLGQHAHPSAPRLYTIKQFAAVHPAFSESALRNLIFKAGPRTSSKGLVPGNGLFECGALVRLGRRILVDELKFLNWVCKTKPVSTSASRAHVEPDRMVEYSLIENTIRVREERIPSDLWNEATGEFEVKVRTD